MGHRTPAIQKSSAAILLTTGGKGNIASRTLVRILFSVLVPGKALQVDLDEGKGGLLESCSL